MYLVNRQWTEYFKSRHFSTGTEDKDLILMMGPNNDCSFLKEFKQYIRFLTFSGLALPHQEGSSSVLQIQKEPLRVTTSDLPKIPPEEVGDREEDQRQNSS